MGVAAPARAVLAVGWILLLAVCVVLGERQSPLRDLQHAVAAGEVHQVRLEGGLPSRGRGFATVTVHWRDGLLGHTTRVIEARPRSAAPRASGRDGTAVVGEDLGARLQARQPGLDVVRVPRTGWTSSLQGWVLPGWADWLVLSLGLGTLLLLMGSPEPWRASRWAWFWLMSIAPPVGITAYLMLSGPVPLLPAPRSPARRLRGGFALLLALVLSSVLGTCV